ncbi:MULTISPECIES: hypothetical protein [Acidithiobacillaceae]|uniref:Uncharacterized protein n=1 Tax=Igneacidithiobacillus copahuensis TaxID=2724909 RepID=A0AAE2YQX7_9PROT|nr:MULTISPECIES: hypothetical protein [Acidithiobacillaceae]MBU2763331.1 hypothetical protein [Acidithiobacillus caldus]MBU2771175.1 hypothetical protein [Acidithiobacillus caldus]MBU2788398.1 hypothetical protein [Igneacidithiobacillus copahuensis]MBU2796365.1 hypothetical protein [Acidithiobacillus sp. VAN18-2]
MKEQRFDSVTDFLELDEQTFQRMLPDLIAWHRLTRENLRKWKWMENMKVARVRSNGFVWVDDGKPGNNLGVRVTLKGK